MTAIDIITMYISFFEKRGHKRIPGAPLIPDNDPTTLFTSSGMQPLVPYLLGETHPQGTRLVNVQNSFRAVDIEEVGDYRHTTFFRMLGNWSLGDYFKEEQLSWVWEFYTKELGLDPKKLYVSIFAGNDEIERDETAYIIWQKIFKNESLDPKGRIFEYGVDKNWWSRSGTPDKMPAGEPGGPDSEIFYDFGGEYKFHESSPWKDEACHPNCDCGRYWEIGNNVFMQYLKTDTGFIPLPKQNVDFGGGLERLIGATENQPDMFLTSLFAPTIQSIEKATGKKYQENKKYMQIIADHFGGSMAMIASGLRPSNKEQGYILRRLLRRSLDNLWELKKNAEVRPILEQIAVQYKDTDPELVEKFEEISLVIEEEKQGYEKTLTNAKKLIEKEIKKIPSQKILNQVGNEIGVAGVKGPASAERNEVERALAGRNERQDPEDLPGIMEGDELMGVVEISPETAFKAISSFGLSPTQLKSLGYTFNQQELAEKIKQHKLLSQTASSGKFKGGLADTEELTVKGHTATHLLQQALRDVLGPHVFQTGSNITTERLRFDFSHPDKLTHEHIEKVQEIVRKKIQEDLPVHFEMLPLKEAKDTGAIGLFDEKYGDIVKVYFIGPSKSPGRPYSVEFCGGPHVPHTGVINSFTITKQESIGKGQQRIYAIVS